MTGGYVFTGVPVQLSGGGGTPIRPMGGGTPSNRQGGTPIQLTGGGGTPSGQWRGYPIQLTTGVPPSSQQWGTLFFLGWGYSPSIRTGWDTPCPDLGWGYPPIRTGWVPPPPVKTGWGYPPHPDLGWGTPPTRPPPSPLVLTWDLDGGGGTPTGTA